MILVVHEEVQNIVRTQPDIGFWFIIDLLDGISVSRIFYEESKGMLRLTHNK